MIPMQFYANVRLPYYGWFGEAFDCEQAARDYIARMLRSARSQGGMFKPSYRSRDYYIRPQLLPTRD